MAATSEDVRTDERNPEPGLGPVQGDAVFVVAVDGTITHANHRALAMTGRPHGEIVGTHLGDHVSTTQPRLARVRHRDGADVTVSLWVSQAPDATTIVTARAMDDAPQNERADEVAELVHDLKSPLSTIGLEIAMLQMRLGGASGDSVYDSLARLVHVVDDMDRAIHDLLDVAMLDAGRFNIQLKPIEVVAFVADVLVRTVSTCDRGRVRFEPCAPIVATIDDARIERVIATLVRHATKRSPRDSPVRVEVERRASVARVSVIDRGPRPTPADESRHFDRYQPRPGHSPVSGLALHISREIVQAHGGRVGVDCAGTEVRFYFDVPVA